MFRQNLIPLISACSVGIGAYFGAHYERWRGKSQDDSSASSGDLPQEEAVFSLGARTLFSPWTLHASSAPISASPAGVPMSSNVSTIMRFGYPSLGILKVYEDYVLLYDRRNKNAYWVFEHLSPHKLPSVKDSDVDRSKSNFYEDKSMHEYFRSLLADYKGSGFDRGHLAAAGNHRHSQSAMDETFILSNISPQVGEGFNRGIWNDLEKFTRSIARKNRNTYVCTGPLYLPRSEPDGKVYVKYQVIGRNQVAVPTHFFKIILTETNDGQFDMFSYVLPNAPVPDKTPLAKYYMPVDAIERASGFLFFDKLNKKQIRFVNGSKR